MTNKTNQKTVNKKIISKDLANKKEIFQTYFLLLSYRPYCNVQTKRNDKHCNIADSKHYGTVITDDDAGEKICSRCGVVLEENAFSYSEFIKK